LLLNDIPFTSYNSDDVFYLNSFVKPLLAYLRITVDPYDFQSIGEMLPTLYIAKDKIKELGKIQQQNPIANPIEYATDLVNSAFQKSKIKEKIRIINSVAKLKPIVAIKILRTEYEKFLVGEESEESTSLHREIVAETLDELENSSKKFLDIGTYIAFVDRVIKNAKLQKETKKKSNYDSVKLMSIHRAKGKEFPVIFGIMQNELILPHKSAFEICSDVIGNGVNELIEEERRLLYVLLTRAEDELKLSYVAEHRGKPLKISRFLEEYI
jgi:DNA helicase-2/ATP-dependent DNA helicase PcrA